MDDGYAIIALQRAVIIVGQADGILDLIECFLLRSVGQRILRILIEIVVVTPLLTLSITMTS